MSWLPRTVFLPCLLLVACGLGSKSQLTSPYLLATWMENKVNGEIRLTWDDRGQVLLEAVFTPDRGCHLYGKDIPPAGVDGLGRPTLLEISPDSLIMPAGELIASEPAILDEEIPGLLIYPVGRVTLTLPIILPEGKGWFDDLVAVTYMACKNGTCYPPVEGKIIPVSVPGLEELKGK